MTPPHVTAAVSALYAAAPAYHEAEAFYNGDVEEIFSSRRLRLLLGNAGRHFRVNYARTPVDALLEKTQIQGITVTGERTSLDDAWVYNELGLEAKDIHRRAYEFGDSFLIGWPDPEVPGGVTLFAHDPRSVRVFYDTQNPRRKSHAIHEWTERGSEENGLGRSGLWWRVNLYYEDRVEQWVGRVPIDETKQHVAATYINGIGVESDPGLIPFGDDPVVENPTPGLIPVFHFRTSRPYGRPEHADAFGPQNMLNKLNITMMSAVDFAGFPQRYVATDLALDPSPQTDAFRESPIDVIEGELVADSGLSDESSMEAGPGSTWLLSGANIKVGEFAVAQTQNFLNAVESLIRQMAAVTDTPAHYFDRSGQMPSGEAFRRSEAPLNDKLADREAQFGVTWAQVFQYIAAVNGAGDTDAQVAWAPPSGVALDKESWETAALQLAAGVSPEVVYAERGYTPEIADEFARNLSAQPLQPALPASE